jgi:epoxyqueuosine reductase
MLDTLAEIIGADGFTSAFARLPQKAMAVRGGLARYGRNNIGFVEGMGTFAQTTIAWSDLPAEEDPWRDPVTLPRCDKCTACVTACPTGAIGEDRILLYGERCLTHINEHEGDWPDWLPADAHHTLVGCMRCQQACPEDRAVLGSVSSGPSFTAAETASFLAATPREELGAETIAKLDSLETFLEYELLCRNLAATLGA